MLVEESIKSAISSIKTNGVRSFLTALAIIIGTAAVLDIDKEDIDIFLNKKVDGENFNRFIVIKDSKNGPYLSWVKVGVSDLYNVEIIEGLTKGDVVYILPSKSLFDYQERFKERVSGSFSFG